MNLVNMLRRNYFNILKNIQTNLYTNNIRRNASIAIYRINNFTRLTNIQRFNAGKTYFKSFLIAASFLTWIGFNEEDENKESELIMTLKRSVLCIQRREYVKAEQMLHLALRLAQEQRNEEGITYAYDLMANLAMERNQFDKSEKLFVSVLQRLLSKGTSEDDIKVIHISLKLARISQIKKDYQKAEIGYQWCLETLEKHRINDKNTMMLKGVILDWYSNFLALKGDYKTSLNHLEEAYQIYKELEGPNNEKTVLLLNDLATINCECGNYEIATRNLEEALTIGKKLDDFNELGTIYANFGIVKMKLGLLNEAKKLCKEGWRLGKKNDNRDSMEQANYCFEQLNSGKK